MIKRISSFSAFIYGPNQFDKNRTALHAAALRGNQGQLNILVNSSISTQDRINNDYRKTFHKRYIRDNCFFRRDMNYQSRLTIALSKYPKRVRNQFQTFLNEIKRIAMNTKQQKPFDLVDIGGNTPLHLAAACGHQQCCNRLSKSFSQNGFACSTMRRNADGWRPRDYLLQFIILNSGKDDTIDLVPQLSVLPFDQMVTMKSRILDINKNSPKKSKFYERVNNNNNEFSSFPDDRDSNIQNVSSNTSKKYSNRSVLGFKRFATIKVVQADTISRGASPPSISASFKQRESQIQGSMMSSQNNQTPAIKAPILAIRVSKQKRLVVNALIRKLLDFKFNVLIFRPLNQPSSLYLLLSLQSQIVEKQAESLKIFVRNKISLEFQPFTCLKRVQSEPFRSKDLQRITLQYLRNFIDFNMLTSQKALQNVILLHKVEQLKPIKDYWLSRKWYKPAPFNLIRQLFTQGQQINYPQFTTLRNYFGEMRAFYYAWVSFYTAWLLIPVVPGTVLFFVRLFFFGDVAEEDQHLIEVLLPIFSGFICIWGSLVVIKWQRKASEIATKWGLMSEIDNPIRQKRVEFNGDYAIDNVTHSIISYTPKGNRYLLLLLSVPILIGLLGCSVFIFLFLQNQKEKYQGQPIMQLLFGTINGISISIINLIYQTLANWSTDRQNYQYLDSYERALVYKSFFFKFVNSNISLAYAAYATQEGFEQLWYLVVGLILARMVNLFLLGNILPWLMFFIKKKKYFKTLTSIIKFRKAKIRGQEKIGKSSAKVFSKKELKSMSRTQFINSIKRQDYLPRMVYDVKTGRIQGDIPVDSVEMDARMNSAQLVIHRYSQLMVQFGYITMFAAVSPISCLLALFANLLEIKYGIFFDSKYLQRNVSHKATGIGTWQAIWEFLTIISIVSNILICYIVFVGLRTKYSSEINFIWALIFIEHVLVMLRSTFIDSPSSKAKWVLYLINKKQFDETQNKKLKEVLTQKKMQKLEKQLQKSEKANNSLKLNYRNLQDDEVKKKKVIEKQENEIEKLQLQIQFQNQQINDSKRLSVFGQSGPNLSFEQRGSLLTSKRLSGVFFKKSTGRIKSEDSENDSESEQHERAAIDLVKNQHILEQAYRYTKAQPGDITQLILQNIALQMLSSTYTRLQKQYLTNRIGLISKFSSKSCPILLCAQCSKNQAFYFCRQCKDNFCEACFTQIHYRSKLNHYRFPLSALSQQPNALDESKSFIQMKNQKSTFHKQQLQQSNDLTTDTRKQNKINPVFSSQQQDKWIKMQQFSFPINKDTLYYKQLVAYFKFLIQEYIYKNFINQKRQNGRVLNLQLFFLHRSRTALLSQTMLQQIDFHLYQASKLDGSNFPHLNDEEKIFLNRIVYRLLQQSLISARYMFEQKIQDENNVDQYQKVIGRRLNSKRNATFSQFLKDVKKLQNGTFEQKVLFLCYLMDNNSNGMVKKSELKQFLSILMIQKVPGSYKTPNQKSKKPNQSMQAFSEGSEQIVNLIFDSVNEFEQGGHRSRNQIDKKVMFKLILNDPRIKRAMEVVLQEMSENYIFSDLTGQAMEEKQTSSNLLPQIVQRQNLVGRAAKVRFEEGLNPMKSGQKKQMARSYPNRFF